MSTDKNTDKSMVYEFNIPFIRKLLELREGRVEAVYLDSLGYPTAGIGHLLVGAEKRRYKVGQSIPAELVDEWFDKDVVRFLNVTRKQLKELGIVHGYMELASCLVSANYQLGNIKSVLPNTWGKLVQGDTEGFREGCKAALWARQTPVRVQDIVEASRVLDGVDGQNKARNYFKNLLGIG